MTRLVMLGTVVLWAFCLGGCSTNTPIGKAAKRGDLAEIERLIHDGADVNRGPDFVVPLNEAIYFDASPEVVKLLIASGANVNRSGKSRAFSLDLCGTPLHFAVYKKNVDAVKLLLGHDADIAALTCDGRAATPLQEARRTGAQPEIVKLLLQAEAQAVDPPTFSATEPGAPGRRAGVASARVGSDIDTFPAVTPRSQPTAYAVVIGIEHYRQQLPAADFAVHDAETVAKYLTRVLGYPEENVVTLLDNRATNVDLVKYFEKWLPNHVEPGGTVFVYFSGHGAPNPQTGDAYLVPSDGDPAFIDETGYGLKRLYAALGKLPAAEITVALDSCFSGAGGRSVIARGTRSIALNLKAQALLPSNLTVLAASSGEQTSSTYAEKGHGLFTYFFLKGIRDEDVVADDGSLRLDALFAYLQPQVERVARREFNNEQTPQLIGLGGD